MVGKIIFFLIIRITTPPLYYNVGPKLPYDVQYSSMVITEVSKRIFLIGGNSFKLEKTLKSILELVNGMSEWKVVEVPINNFRKEHLSLQLTKGNKMNFFCGEYKLFVKV